MTVELHVEGKVVKLWQVAYQPGPFPMTKILMAEKELYMQQVLLQCQRDSLTMTWNKDHHFELVFSSRFDPEDIDNEEYQDFLWDISKNKNR